MPVATDVELADREAESRPPPTPTSDSPCHLRPATRSGHVTGRRSGPESRGTGRDRTPATAPQPPPAEKVTTETPAPHPARAAARSRPAKQPLLGCRPPTPSTHLHHGVRPAATTPHHPQDDRSGQNPGRCRIPARPRPPREPRRQPRRQHDAGAEEHRRAAALRRPPSAPHPGKAASSRVKVAKRGGEKVPAAAGVDLASPGGGEGGARRGCPRRRRRLGFSRDARGRVAGAGELFPVGSTTRPIEMAGTSISDSENLVFDETTNAGIEVTTNNTFSLESNSTFGVSATKVVVENTMEVTSGKYSSSVEVDVPLMRFLKGKGGSVQKQIEQETGVKLIFPSAKEETLVVLEGENAESIGKASERIAKILEEAVQSPMLDYSHFVSLPLAIHPDLVEKLNNFQRSILGVSASNVDSDKDEIQSEGSVDEIDEAASPSVSVKLPVQEEKPVIVKMDNKGSQPEFGIDKSIFIKSKTFHLTVLMLKLWNKDRIAQASDVLQSVSSQVNEALENRPISIQLRSLTWMKGSPARARVVYAPVLEVLWRTPCSCLQGNN